MNRERLEKAVETLINVEKQELPFNMSRWFTNVGCGTAACALGHISLQEWANEAGLAPKKSINSTKKTGFDYNVPIFHHENGCDYIEFHAGRMFFDISLQQSYWLFDPQCYLGDFNERIKPGRVIKRMRFLLDFDGDQLDDSRLNDRF